MVATNFNLRGIDPKVMTLLKQEAEKQRISVNLLILNCIKKSLGFSHPVKRPVWHDLDHLAGTWGEEEAKIF